MATRDMADGAYAGAKMLLERWKTQRSHWPLPDEVYMVQDLLERIELNAERIANALQDPRRRRAATASANCVEAWSDVKALLVEQNDLFTKVAKAVQALSTKPLNRGNDAAMSTAP
ncbi:hypothetical protein P43SY_011459 [Pythium insidiosum]|uniref:Uncharacterized protein n=1 Tax=Pythium insidiosum TaxID=114742 RepID=A0AAD5Q7P8_PYTIN|nr:hypothetical protein P43SY_011459 [Pythium insidiosum]